MTIANSITNFHIPRAAMSSLLGETAELLNGTLISPKLTKVLHSNWSPEYQATRFALGENYMLLRALKDQPYFPSMSTEAQSGVDELIETIRVSKETMHRDRYVKNSTFEGIQAGLKDVRESVRQLVPEQQQLTLPETPAISAGWQVDAFEPQLVERTGDIAAEAVNVMRA